MTLCISKQDLRADEMKQSEAFPTRWLKSRDGATARVPSLESREAKKHRDSHQRPRKKCKAGKLHYKEEVNLPNALSSSHPAHPPSRTKHQ